MNRVLFLLLFASAVFALDASHTDYIEAKITISRDIMADGQITSAVFSSYDLPQGELVSMTLPQNSKVEKDSYGNTYLVTEWETTEHLSYTVEAVVRSRLTENTMKVPPLFPYVAPKGFEEYLDDSRYIFVTPEISQKALEITDGSRDSFEAIARVANWVNGYVKYDTAYGDEIKSAEWVFANRKGTCDEYTSLFISMVRSLNVPARYVSGIALGSVGGVKWQNHGWAEVYLDQWIPVDPTFNEIGFLDATHIKLATVSDPSELESKIEWQPGDVNVKLGPPSLSVDVLDSRNESHLTNISVDYDKFEIGAGSSLEVKSYVKDNSKGCIGSKIRISVYKEESPGKSFDILYGGDSQLAVLCPDRDAGLSWILRTPYVLDTGFSYFYDTIVYDSMSENRFKITVNPDVSDAPAMSISLGKNVLAIGEETVVSVVMHNTLDHEVNSIKLFTDFGIYEKDIEIPAGEEKAIEFRFTPTRTGNYGILAYSPHSSVGVNFSVVSSKNLIIKNLSFPDFIRPGETDSISAVIENLGSSQNINVHATSDLFDISSIYEIGKGEEMNVVISVDVPEEVRVGSYPITLRVSSGSGFDEQTKNLLIYKEPKVIAEVDTSSVYADIASHINIKVRNEGEIAIRNVTLSFSPTPDFELPVSLSSIDRIQPGGEGFAELVVLSRSLGERKLVLNLNYQDDYRKYSDSSELTINVLKPGILERIKTFILNLLGF